MPEFAPFPTKRIERSRAFENVGLFWTNLRQIRERKEENLGLYYVTCRTIRAVHMEIVTDMSAVTFLNALRRFVSRRGKPETTVVSDNAPAFHLVNKTIEKGWKKLIEDEEVQIYCAKEGIKWIFIPQYSPMGRRYLRTDNKNCKISTSQGNGQHILPCDDFQTLIIEIKGIINSRPLTYVSSESEPWHILRRIDFLNVDSRLGTPWEAIFSKKGEVTDSREQLLEIWANSTNLLEDFWKQWSTEYLQSLRERNQYQHKGSKAKNYRAKKGEIVLAVDESLPRSSWKLTKIIGFPKSSDSRIRTAYIQYPNGKEAERSLRHLIPLEISQTFSDNADPELTDETADKGRNSRGKIVKSKERTNSPNKLTPEGAKVNSEPKNQHSMITRSKVAAGKNVVYFLMLCLIFLNPVMSASHCNQIGNSVEVYRTRCKNPAVVVLKDGIGKMCYISEQCEGEHEVYSLFNETTKCADG